MFGVIIPAAIRVWYLLSAIQLSYWYSEDRTNETFIRFQLMCVVTFMSFVSVILLYALMWCVCGGF